MLQLLACGIVRKRDSIDGRLVYQASYLMGRKYNNLQLNNCCSNRILRMKKLQLIKY